MKRSEVFTLELLERLHLRYDQAAVAAVHCNEGDALESALRYCICNPVECNALRYCIFSFALQSHSMQCNANPTQYVQLQCNAIPLNVQWNALE